MKIRVFLWNDFHSDSCFSFFKFCSECFHKLWLHLFKCLSEWSSQARLHVRAGVRPRSPSSSPLSNSPHPPPQARGPRVHEQFSLQLLCVAKLCPPTFQRQITLYSPVVGRRRRVLSPLILAPWNLQLSWETELIIQGVFFQWYPTKKLKYGKPRLGESTLT